MSNASPSTRRGTSALMIAMSYLSGFGGVISGIVLMVHTASPGCTGWVGCYEPHTGRTRHRVPCRGHRVSALFSGLGSIARSIGEIQANRSNTTPQLESTPPPS